jgi:hypothetical protein
MRGAVAGSSVIMSVVGMQRWARIDALDMVPIERTPCTHRVAPARPAGCGTLQPDPTGRFWSIVTLLMLPLLLGLGFPALF